MKIPRFILAGLPLATLLTILLPLHLVAAPSNENVLIDFRDSTVDRFTGEKTKNYDFAWDDWGKHVADLAGKGCLIQSPTNKGCVGEDRTSVKFDKTTTVALEFVIGNANSAKSINLDLEDNDGTEQSWNISLENLNKGQLYRMPLDLTKCTTEAKPGKKPGMNFKKISTWKIQGDWSQSNIEILLIRLVAPKT